MKRFLMAVCIIVFMLNLVCCAGDGGMEGVTDVDTEPETASWERSDIPEYYRPHREIADKAVMSEFGIVDLSPYKIEVSPAKDERCVKYTLCLGGYETSEMYFVYLTAEKEVRQILGEYGEYAKYLESATDEAFAAAKKGLAEQIAVYEDDGKAHYYLTVDDEGYLCLTAEVIVNYDEPDEWGMDHTHVFLKERVCR